MELDMIFLSAFCKSAYGLTMGSWEGVVCVSSIWSSYCWVDVWELATEESQCEASLCCDPSTTAGSVLGSWWAGFVRQSLHVALSLVDSTQLCFHSLWETGKFPLLCILVLFLPVSLFAHGVEMSLLLLPISPDFKLFQIVHWAVDVSSSQIDVFDVPYS